MGPGGERWSDMEAELESEEPMEMGCDVSTFEDNGDRGINHLRSIVPSGLPSATSSSPTSARSRRDPFHRGQGVRVGCLLHPLLFLDLHSPMMLMSFIVDHLVHCFPQNGAFL